MIRASRAMVRFHWLQAKWSPGVIAFVAQPEAGVVEFEFVELGRCGHGTNWRPIFLSSAW